jgi:hypothetical protein
MNDKILFGVTQNNEFLTINIPVDLLIHVLENHEDCEGIKVRDVSSFIDEMSHSRIIRETLFLQPCLTNVLWTSWKVMMIV